MAIVYLNGSFIPEEEASISPLDRGFLFADGVYEVVPAYRGKLFRLQEHIDRLRQSLKAIRIDTDFDDSMWSFIMEELVRQNGGGNLSVYLQISRGAPKVRDHSFPPKTVEPTIFAMTNPIKKPAVDFLDNAEGSSAITLDDIRWSRCDIKSVSLLPNILLRQQAHDADAQEAILLKDGFVTEGSASNVFIVKNGVIKTPPKSHYILGGVTRDLLIDLVTEEALSFSEEEISEAELQAADEVWITSSTKEINPVTSLNHQTLGDGQVGPVWKRVAKLYLNYKRALFEREV